MLDPASCPPARLRASEDASPSQLNAARRKRISIVVKLSQVNEQDSIRMGASFIAMVNRFVESASRGGGGAGIVDNGAVASGIGRHPLRTVGRATSYQHRTDDSHGRQDGCQRVEGARGVHRCGRGRVAGGSPVNGSSYHSDVSPFKRWTVDPGRRRKRPAQGLGTQKAYGLGTQSLKVALELSICINRLPTASPKQMFASYSSS